MKFREYKNIYSTDKVRKGIVRGKSLSDELDSATVVLTQVSKMDIEPNDLIELNNETGGLEYWLAANYNRKYVSFNPVRYDYVVDLVSITRLLETIILPNLTITNIGQNRTILTYIENAMSLYFKSKYGGFKIASKLTELCGSAICPECTFEEPTLKEYLDYLLGFKNCLARLEFKNGFFILTCLDLNPNGTELDTKYITSMEQSQTAEQYVTQLEHDFKNVIGQRSIIEYHRLKSDSYMFDSKSAKLILNQKPYDIKSVKVKNLPFDIWAYLTMSNNENTIDHAEIHFNSNHAEGTESGGLYRYVNNVDLDITDYVVIDRIFQSLETLKEGVCDTLTDSLVKNNYQNNSLRWSRGSRTIDNFDFTQTKTILWTSSDEPAITYVIRSAIYKALNKLLTMANYVDENGVSYIYSTYNDSTKGIRYAYNWADYEKVVFEVEYIPYINTKLKLQQEGEFRHLISATDNTTNASTDISSFIRKSLEKNKQLGNDALLIYGRSIVEKDGYNPVYELGQFYVDEDGSKYILNYLETETKNACILYKGILTKNYSNRNIHTIINREKRYYSLADNSQSIVRNEVRINKYKLTLSNYEDSKVLMLAVPFNILEFKSTANEDSSTFSGYISSNTIAEKNIISHSALFEDNIVYATRVGEQQNGGYQMEYLKYVDSYGETSAIETDFKCATGNNIEVILNCESVDNDGEAFIGSSKGEFKFLKDSREQLCLTVENIIVNDTNDSNIIVNEDTIANLLNSDTINIVTDQIGYRMVGKNKANFGKPLHEIINRSHSYPTKLEIKDGNGNVCITINAYNGEYLSLELLADGDNWDPSNPGDGNNPGGGETPGGGNTSYKMFYYSYGGLNFYNEQFSLVGSYADLVYNFKTYDNELPLQELIEKADLTQYPDAKYGCVEVAFSGTICLGSYCNFELKGVSKLILVTSNYEEVILYSDPSAVQTYRCPVDNIQFTMLRFFVDLNYLKGSYVKKIA